MRPWVASSCTAILTTALLAATALPVGAQGAAPGARPAAAAAALEVLPVQGNVYLIAGAGANITAQVGPDGIVLVDAGNGTASAAVVAALKALTPQPIRVIITTGGDADHIGGTEALGAAGQPLSGPPLPVFGAEALLLRLSAATGAAAVPGALWPTDTFLDKTNLYLNGEAIQIVHEPAAHSDGDSTVFFRRSDVVAAGDILDLTRFPVIDVAAGGSIQGELAALNRLVDLVIPPTPLTWEAGGTKVVPGHGWICEQADVVEYRDMLTIIRDVVADLIAQGLTLEQVQAAQPTRGYTRQYGAETGPWTTRQFVAAVYQSLKAAPAVAGKK
jgi:glyoxylase-like metal-dependent hydrolase (beta-lactamase superfamily II)